MAEQNDVTLKSLATQIKTETINKANTALRVGTLLENLVDSKLNIANVPTYSFSSEEFYLDGSVLFNKGGYHVITTPSINLTFVRNLGYGTIDEPLTGTITQTLTGANPFATAKLLYTNTSLSLDSNIYRIEDGSPTFDSSKINLLTFTYFANNYIGYNITKYNFLAENLIGYSNKFDEFATWGQDASITRTQEVDDSWTLTYPAGASLLNQPAVVENKTYTLSFELKSVPSDYILTVYAMPDFTPLLIDSPLFPDTNGSTFVRVSRTVTIPATKTSLYIILEAPTGGTVQIQNAQLNRGVVVKPYIETTVI